MSVKYIMNLTFSIGKIILILYIIISSSYCVNLFSNGIKRAIEDNKFVQHLLLLLLIMTILVLFEIPYSSNLSSSNTINLAIYTIIIYVWFILTTKLDASWNIGIIILLGIYFLYESNQSYNLKILDKDNNLSQEEKKIEYDKNAVIDNYMLLGIFAITVVGVLFYSSEKQVQYGGGYDIMKFWFN